MDALAGYKYHLALEIALFLTTGQKSLLIPYWRAFQFIMDVQI